MNFFDATILHFMNGLIHRSWTFDYLIMWITRDEFQKGGIIMMLLWFAWFMQSEKGDANREILLCTVVAAPLAVGLSRFISYFAPFRLRPLHNPSITLRLAESLSPQTLIYWNSFPSDHAALFFTFVAGLFFVSRRLGCIALTYVLFLICFPRICLGLHYPTDILGGAVLGISVAYLASLPKLRTAVARPTLSWMALNPAPCYAVLFFYTYQVSNAFGWLRDVIVFVTTIFNAVKVRF